MTSWRTACVSKHASIGDALAAIDASSLGIALAVDADGRLAGVATDGDIRRGLLLGKTLDEPIMSVLNPNPLIAPTSASRGVLLALMRANGVHQLPILDAERRITNLVTIDALVGADARPNHVVVMAGGEGRRLHPLTLQTPKPLVSVGGQPMLNWVLSAIASHGFRSVFISTRFEAQQVRAYAQDGSPWGLSINYLDEEEPLGTAGSLSLLPVPATQPILVMNADVLTDVDLGELVESHEQSGADMTIAVREHRTAIPYGIVELDNGNAVLSVQEKPVLTHTISAGIYILSPRVLDLIPTKTRVDMTDVIKYALSRGRTLRAQGVSEQWIDIGRHEELESARNLFSSFER